MRAKTCSVVAMTVALASCATSRPAKVGPANSPNASSDGGGSAGLTGSGDPAVQQLIVRMEEEWARASARSDSSTIGRMIAAEYFSVNSDGVENRTQILNEFGTTNSEFTQLYSPDSAMIVRVYGDMAVVTAIGNSAARNNKNGLEYRTNVRYVETWIRREGTWQVVAGAYQGLLPPKEILIAQLLRAEQGYSQVFAQRDSLAFDRLVSDSVIFAPGADPVETKVQLWGDIKGSEHRTNDHHVDRAFVTADVGTVNGTINRSFKDGSRIHLRYADTWVYWGGHWRLIARQLVPASDGH
jgi:ketosteroid isomerase-like protein